MIQYQIIHYNRSFDGIKITVLLWNSKINTSSIILCENKMNVQMINIINEESEPGK